MPLTHHGVLGTRNWKVHVIRHSRNETCSVIVSGIVTGDVLVSYWLDWCPCPLTASEVFANINPVQFPCQSGKLLLLTWPENCFPSRVCSDPRSLAQPKWTWNWSNLKVLSSRGPPVSEAPLESAISSWGECPVFINVPVTRPLALSKVIFRGLKLSLTVSLLTMFIGDCFRCPQSSYLYFQSSGPSTVFITKRTHLWKGLSRLVNSV